MNKLQKAAYDRLCSAEAAVESLERVIDNTDYGALYGDAGREMKNRQQSALGLAEIRLERARRSFQASFARRATRSISAALTAFLADYETFDVGFVNHGRTGPDDCVQWRKCDPARVAEYVRRVIAEGVNSHFVYARIDGKIVARFAFDSRHTTLANFGEIAA